jgi:hypothetical protein
MEEDEGYNDKIYENYKDEYKNFKTSFGILIGFTIVFFFFIFLPYYYNLSVIDDSSSEQKRIGQDIKIIKTRLVN